LLIATVIWNALVAAYLIAVIVWPHTQRQVRWIELYVVIGAWILGNATLACLGFIMRLICRQANRKAQLQV